MFENMFNLTGRKALITGASGGIGQSVAKVLHARGASVGLQGTRVDSLNALADELGERVYVFPADLMQRDAVKELAKKAEAEMGGVDILINNAGVTRDGLCLRMSDEAWDHVLEVNLTAVFHLTRDLLGSMARRRFGRIVNVSSVVGVTGNPGQVNYAASKGGMIAFSKSLAREIASRGITVNCVAPGFIKTAMTEKLDKKQMETIMSVIPMRRIGEADEVAFAIAYLVSDEASYVTGQTLHINGGMAMI